MRPRLFAAALAISLAAAVAAQAATMEVKSAWIRTPPPGARTAAGYGAVTNHGIASDRLTGAYTNAAASVGLHEMTKQAGVMRMREIKGGLAIGASATVTLSPSGRHLMLTGLKRPLKAGQHVRIVLQFQRAGEVTADFVVRDQPAGMRM
jgi:hypothetical protein